MPPFKDDQIFTIAPGSQTTLAQLGLPESFTPARFRFASRMFPAQEDGQYEPVKIRRKEKKLKPPAAPQTDITSASNGDAPVTTTEPAPRAEAEQDEDDEWEEDRLSSEGAIYPIKKGTITDWPCFYALMEHVYQSVNPPFHTPILLISEPVWTHKEHEKVAQFFFEKFKTPALAMMDSAVAASYAYGVPNATVVDVGYEKADVTCIADFVLQDVGRSLAVPECGGEAMTGRLAELLRGRKGFTRDVCEQLKKSAICEVLASDADLPTKDNTGTDIASNPAAAASTGASASGSGGRKPSVADDLPRGPGPGTQVGEEKKLEDEDGVLDIASIVTGGNMTEYLAQKEQQKAEKAAAKQKKGDAKDSAANKPVKLPNSKRARNTFVYEDLALHDAMKNAGMTNQGMSDMQSALSENAPNKRQKTPEPQSAVSDKPADNALTAPAPVAEASPTAAFRREVEVGLERFQAASGGLLDRLADTIYRTVQSCGEINRRADLWDSLIILGNGSKVRGFKEALLTTLQAKYIISPSSATMFTSEIPSNLSTPAATGANTPLPGGTPLHQGMGPAGVNPLLHAALTARSSDLSQMQTSQMMGSTTPLAHLHSSTSHSQTPSSIRLAKIPEYFPEWKETGYDEAAFLGAQVAGKLLFIVDGGASKGYLTRTDYNEQGPQAIHDVRM